MSPNKILIFALVAILFISSVESMDDHRVHKMCAATNNTKLCVAVVRADPHKELKTNFTGLLKITTNAALVHATKATTYLKHRISTEKNETNKQGLKYCLSDGYETDLTEQFQYALEILNDPRDQDPKSNERYNFLGRYIVEGAMSAILCLENPNLSVEDPLRIVGRKVWAIGMIAADLVSLEHCNKINCYK